MPRLVLFNKPYGVLSQFTGAPAGLGVTLADYLPLPGVYPAGRLDKDSEGLLLLTDDGALQHRISHPKHKEWKTYWAQVEGTPDETQLEQLRRGVTLNDGPTRPARVRNLAEPDLWPRDPPVRFRKSVPTAWIELEIHEGRNRQVRRMTAAVGLPTLRLVRAAIGTWRLDALAPGDYRVIETDSTSRDRREPTPEARERNTRPRQSRQRSRRP
ncbi:pseudouridine synthase [Thiorhodococcus fuscus]|uniref:Pseudouridine synthase n=1 Tax=Thiorhodococcus fuscus TaxID=527200 RepID=A0ABW4Y711_9GAMM